MSFLTEHCDGAVRGVHTLSRYSTLLGRSSECDIQLFAPGVADRHLRLVRSGYSFFMHRLAPTARTEVNGAVPHRLNLSNGDRIEIGQCVMDFHEGRPPSMRIEMPRGSLDLLIQLVRRFPDRGFLLDDLERGRQRTGELEVDFLLPSDTVEAMPLEIGRSPACDLQLTDHTVSRRHAQITQDVAAVYLEDLGSRNGTLLNGRLLSGRVRIRPSDQIRLGAVLLRFEESLGGRRSLVSAAKSKSVGSPQGPTTLPMPTGNLEILKELVEGFPEFEFLLEELLEAQPLPAIPDPTVQHIPLNLGNGIVG